MQEAYIKTLSEDTRALVDYIEQHIESEIVVEVDSSRVEILACEVDRVGAKILIPENGYFPESSVMHELIHIRRFCVEEVPKLVVCEAYDKWTPELEKALFDLDNNLEHFVIVPEELKLFPERYEYWESRINSKLDQVYSVNAVKGNTQGSALVYWAFIRHVFPSSQLLDKANAIVQNLGITEAVECCFEQMRPYVQNKEKLVRVWFEHLAITLEAGCFEYIDCRSHSNKEIAVASVML